MRWLCALALALVGASPPTRYHIVALWFATERNIPVHYLVLHAESTRVSDAADIFWVLRPDYASQYLGVDTPGGTVVLASDDAVMYENIERRIPIAGRFAPGDTIANLQAQDRMHRIASDPTLIFPGHDPAIFSRHPTPGNGVATIE